jgi:hypothetical protein
MKPMILFNIRTNRWSVSGVSGDFTAQQLADKFNISNPILYCQQWREESKNE